MNLISNQLLVVFAGLNYAKLYLILCLTYIAALFINIIIHIHDDGN